MKIIIILISILLSTAIYASDCPEGKKTFSAWKQTTDEYKIRSSQNEIVENSSVCVLNINFTAPAINTMLIGKFYSDQVRSANVHNVEDAQAFASQFIEAVANKFPVAFWPANNQGISLQFYEKRKFKGKLLENHMVFDLSGNIYNTFGYRI